MASTYNGTTAVGFPIEDSTRWAYEWILAAFGASYAVTYLGLVALGFGPIGIAGGSLAAFIQSFVYGAAVPAGGWFATMTSLGMTGGFHFVASGAGLAGAGMTGFAEWLKRKASKTTKASEPSESCEPCKPCEPCNGSKSSKN